jgi:ubiquinone/menaquinone biosynthesis C-methylase UbiE
MKKKLQFTLFLFSVLFISTIFISQTENYDTQSKRIEAWEKRINDERQPPEQVMDAIGVVPGMIIGEIGAGRGRYTVHLASRVGNEGKIYANDIDKDALEYLRQRCRHNNIQNIETILGEEVDPLFPEQTLDMAIMVWVYHMLDRPVPLLKNLKFGLKPGATLVILDPPDEEIDAEIKQMKGKLDPDRLTIKERIETGADEAGFELVRMETFLPKDTIYILKIKNSPAVP